MSLEREKTRGPLVYSLREAVGEPEINKHGATKGRLEGRRDDEGREVSW